MDDQGPRFIQGTSGPDTLIADASGETLSGGAGNDSLAGGSVLIGGPGDDTMAGGVGGATFEIQWEWQTTTEAFRGGHHPDDHADSQAWNQYERQAIARGYDQVIGQTAGGHDLAGKVTVTGTPDFADMGVDVVLNFNARLNVIEITGVSNPAEFRTHLSLDPDPAHFTVSYDGHPFLEVPFATSGAKFQEPPMLYQFSLDWIIVTS